MKTQLTLALGLIIFFLTYSCKKNEITAFSDTHLTTITIGSRGPRPAPRLGGRPNIIFLLADDMGYEMPTFDGGGSYNTTHLDSLAAQSMVFNHCMATPICSPSRVELLSGVYNFRNYLKYGWGIYNMQYPTYASILQKNGYTTCVAGKWQLDDWQYGVPQVGFDKYCLLDQRYNLYRTPTFNIDDKGFSANMDFNKYSEDIVSDYVSNFIDENKDRPFFIYYSFSLIHMPDQPTPLDPNYLTFDENLADTSYIGSMTHYLDLKVGVLMNKLKAVGLDQNTIIVFTGDNGSLGNYHSLFHGKLVQGGKGLTIDAGSHVPLFVWWPGHIMPGVNNNPVDFSDFAPTFMDMANVKNQPTGLDGVSFYPQLFGKNDNARTWTYCYYDPYPRAIPGYNAQTQPESWAQDTAYKLYKVGVRAHNLYHYTADPHEQKYIRLSQMTPAQAAEREKLQKALDGLE